MKNIGKIISTLVFSGSIGMNIWHAGVRQPLSPCVGNSINSEFKTEDVNKTSFRIATYNIRGCKGLDEDRDINRTASVLDGFDIIALNEVRRMHLSLCSQAEKLGDILDMGWLFLPNQKRYYQEHYGNGFLSIFDVDYFYREQLVYDDETSHSHRNLATIQFEFNDKLITMIVTHLDRGKIRHKQLSYVIQKFKSYDNCILIGDLNTPRDDSQLKDLLDDENIKDAINIAMGPNDIRRVDWIIAKGFNVLDGGFVPEGISDHPLFWVELEIDQPHEVMPDFLPCSEPQTTFTEPYPDS
ncbi:MAG: endonuclease/exonuclease/phosphatase family protein [Planctomycetota bacterium]|jgi:endonuclease/exonuclease/phosphatase family metal-dependent hydrolase